jgi:serine/threonine-protein kinase
LGRRLADKYQLVEILASGAFGTVFKAHHHFCGQFVRPVAVKVSHQAGLTEANAAALFGDALILAQLMAGAHHPGKQHLVQIFDMGILPADEGRGFLVMEFVDGHPLLAHIRAAGHIGVASGLRYIKEICRALALVHARGAVHRDLKPDNVLIDRCGLVRLVDFGIAAFADPRLGFAPGSFGTFTYMAPETLFGRSTPAADVYGVGLLLYELFTGGGPHLSASWPEGDDQDKPDRCHAVKQSLRFTPPSLVHNEIRNDYRWLDPLILCCLDVNPARRFADAGRLLAALEACEAGQELPEPEPSPSAESRDLAEASHVCSGQRADGGMDDLFREVRRLLGSRAYDQVIDRLDIHRPAEWAVVDLLGARTLRALGQAYLGRGDLRAARECLEQLRTAQKERPLLTRDEHAAALTDLVKCYRGMGDLDQAGQCQEETRRLLSGS